MYEGPAAEAAERERRFSEHAVIDGVARKALELDGLAAPPTKSYATAKFHAGGAVVIARTSEDERHTRMRARYRWNGSLFVPAPISKRSFAVSK